MFPVFTKKSHNNMHYFHGYRVLRLVKKKKNRNSQGLSNLATSITLS